MKFCAALLLTLFLLGCTAPATNTSQWRYDSRRDKLRQDSQPYAFVLSAETYSPKSSFSGNTKGVLQIAKFESGYKLALELGRGHIDCKKQCDIPFSFDNGPVKTFSFKYEDPGNKTLIVPFDSKSLFDRIIASKSVIVEVPITSNGPFQFSFATAGLDLTKLEPVVPRLTSPQNNQNFAP